MKVTIAQIAKAAGVSLGSVSNALNNRKGTISEQKREHIIRIAEQLGYFKRGKRTGIISLVLYDAGETIVQTDQPFFSALIRGMEEGCHQYDYQLRIRKVRSDDQKAIEALDNISESDGLLVMGTEMHFKDVEKFRHFKIPFVIVDNAYIMENCDFVAINNKDGMYEVTKLLIDKGYTKIGLINSLRMINNFKERKLGFLQALADHDLSFNGDDEIFVEPHIEEGTKDFSRFLHQQKELGILLPEAFVAMNDYIALASLRAMKEEGIPIPVVGFDDIEMARYSEPSLTTVRVNKEDLGKIAVGRLIAKFERPEESMKILVNTSVIERNSTK